jgi:membrane-associated phospholipid phosphatase
LFGLFCLLVLPRPAHAEDGSPGPFDGLARNFADSFGGLYLGLHLGAVAATATMSTQDVDVEIRRYFHDHPRWGQAAYPAAILPVVTPAVLFAGLYWKGRSDQRTLGAAWTVLQATALTLGTVTTLKLVTGRPAPRDSYIPDLAADDAKLSRTFRPGIYRGGVIAGWPSGHVAVTTAVLTSLVVYYPEKWWLKLVSAGAIAYMMFGVSSFEAGGMHWASDAAAGMLMAYPIGMSTGRGMRRLVEGAAAGKPSAWFLAPSPRADAPGFIVGRPF